MLSSPKTPEFSSFYQKREIARDYDLARMNTSKKKIIRHLEQAFFSTLSGKPISDKKILEIGAGTGEITRVLAMRNEVTAIDISEEMLAVAREKVTHGAFRCLDMFNIDCLSDTFDVVIASRVFLHLEPNELQEMLSLVTNRLATKGILIFDLQRPSYWRLGMQFLNKGKVRNPNYTIKRIVEIFSDTPNLRLRSIASFDHWPLLFPAAFVSPGKYWRFEKFLFATEKRMMNCSLGASRWGIVCERQ